MLGKVSHLKGIGNCVYQQLKKEYIQNFPNKVYLYVWHDFQEKEQLFISTSLAG
jgi:hypothetical protein